MTLSSLWRCLSSLVNVPTCFVLCYIPRYTPPAGKPSTPCKSGTTMTAVGPPGLILTSYCYNKQHPPPLPLVLNTQQASVPSSSAAITSQPSTAPEEEVGQLTHPPAPPMALMRSIRAVMCRKSSSSLELLWRRHAMKGRKDVRCTVVTSKAAASLQGGAINDRKCVHVRTNVTCGGGGPLTALVPTAISTNKGRHCHKVPHTGGAGECSRRCGAGSSPAPASAGR